MVNEFLEVWNLNFSVPTATRVDFLRRRSLLSGFSLDMRASFAVIVVLSGSFAQDSSTAVSIAVVPVLIVHCRFNDIGFTLLLFPTLWRSGPKRYHLKGIAATLYSTFAALFFYLFANSITLKTLLGNTTLSALGFW